MIYHSVVINVATNTTNSLVDITEQDNNSHQLIIKLVCNTGNHFFNIEGYVPSIEFYDEATDTVVMSDSVTVVNAYRGYLSYVIGKRLLSHPARYTVRLKLSNNTIIDCPSQMTFSFIVNVLRNSTCLPPCCPNTEVTISKEFYEDLKEHLGNQLIHVSECDRAILSYLQDNLDTFVTTENIFQILETSPEFETTVSNIVEKIFSDPNSEVYKSLVDSLLNSEEFLSLVSRMDSLETNLSWVKL